MVIDDSNRGKTPFHDEVKKGSYELKPVPNVPEGFVEVKAGSFKMGSTEGGSDERRYTRCGSPTISG